MYYLMNKDKEILSFSAEKGDFAKSVKFVEDSRASLSLPIGFNDINDWIIGRNASNHNKHIKDILTRYGCNDNESYIRITHALSITDTFWIKSDEENISWKDVSLYENKFTEIISKLAFEGIGLNDRFSPTKPETEILLSGTHSPELAAEGSFRRCFKKENRAGQYGSDIFIYKRGLVLPNNKEGIEMYGEILASEIAGIISPDNSVQYSLNKIDGKVASCCNIFTTEKQGLVPIYRIIGKNASLDDVFEYFKKIGCEEQFREMLVLDSLCFNTDRHLGNIGVIIDNETLRPVCISPIYDLNLSMLPYFELKDFSTERFGNKLLEIKSAFGNDFTELGHIAMSDTLKERIASLEHFEFSFRGNSSFPEIRVIQLERAIREQAKALLDKDKTHIYDVFYSSEMTKHFNLVKKAENMKPFVFDLYDKFSINDSLDISVTAESEYAQLHIQKARDFDFEICVDFVKGKIYPIMNGEKISEKELRKTEPLKYIFYSNTKRQAKDYIKEYNNKKLNKAFSKEFQKE